MSQELTLNDIVVIDGEPSVYDLRLAEVLGYEDRHKIRPLIKRNETELRRYGRISATVAETPNKRGRKGASYYLNEGQALAICALSDAPGAPDARFRLISVYIAWRRGELMPPANLDPHMPAPVDIRTRDLAVLEHVRLTKGPAAASALYDTLPSMPKIPRALPSAPDAQAMACLRHLLAQEVEGRTLKEWIAEAFFPREKAINVLKRLNIELRADGFQVPSVHAGFNELFAGTPWPRPFEHLRKLPGVTPHSPGGGRFAREWTHIPSRYLTEA